VRFLCVTRYIDITNEEHSESAHEVGRVNLDLVYGLARRVDTFTLVIDIILVVKLALVGYASMCTESRLSSPCGRKLCQEK
jgi:hypothetical protein